MKLSLLMAPVVSLLISAPVKAQEWSYSASVYLFTAETQTDIGDLGATLSFSDALENLDGAFMGSFAGNNGQWGFLVDYMLTDLSFDTSTSGTALGGGKASIKTQILTGYLSYRLYNNGSTQTDLLAGARWFDTDTTLNFLPGSSTGGTFNASDSWIDPVIGVRSKFALGGDWSGTAIADYGGFGDRETWQFMLTADYAISDKLVGRIGYRYLDVRNDGIANGYGFNQSGPVIGITYQF